MAHKPQLKPVGKLSMQDFGRMVATGALPPRDRFNLRIEKGHFVLYHPEVDVVYEVTDIVPVMDPTHQGFVKVVLKTTIPLTMPVNRPMMALAICGHSAIQREEGNQSMGNEPAAGEPAEPAPPAEDEPPLDFGPEPTADEVAARLEQIHNEHRDDPTDQ